MPIYQVGDLVRYRDGDLDDLEALGLILEMRETPLSGVNAHVLWNDIPEPQWSSITYLVPVQPARERGITG